MLKTQRLGPDTCATTNPYECLLHMTRGSRLQEVKLKEPLEIWYILSPYPHAVDHTAYREGKAFAKPAALERAARVLDEVKDQAEVPDWLHEWSFEEELDAAMSDASFSDELPAGIMILNSSPVGRYFEMLSLWRKLCAVEASE